MTRKGINFIIKANCGRDRAAKAVIILIQRIRVIIFSEFLWAWHERCATHPLKSADAFHHKSVRMRWRESVKWTFENKHLYLSAHLTACVFRGFKVYCSNINALLHNEWTLRRLKDKHQSVRHQRRVSGGGPCLFYSRCCTKVSFRQALFYS